MSVKKVIIVGYGDRGQAYLKFAEKNPDKIIVAAVVEPNEFRRGLAEKKFNIAADKCFSNIDDCIKLGKFADGVINATMDSQHIETALPFLRLGYDMLLEKPITNNKQDLLLLKNVAKENSCELMICHVLRYTPFYRKIKEIVISEEIGEIVNIESSECVGVAHYSASYARGKWNNRQRCGSSMLLAKCCHDLDLLCWINNKTSPKKVSSLGGRYFFNIDKAPIGSGTRCLVDCEVEEKCIYSCKKLMLDNNYFSQYAWETIDKKVEEITYAEKVESLKTDNPQGVCIYKIDADIVDRQVLIMQFENGSTCTHSMICSVARPGRKIHIIGTKGEIEGFLEDNSFKVRLYNEVNCLYAEREEKIENVEDGDGHSGGDSRLVFDFYQMLCKQPRSISATVIEDSINGHLCVYSADDSLDNGGLLIKIKDENNA